MSLGIYLECPTCGQQKLDRSPTYNLAPMWRLAEIDWDALEGKDGETVGPRIKAAAERMRAEPEKFKALNPPNGWGDYDGLLAVLDDIVTACARSPQLVLRLWR